MKKFLDSGKEEISDEEEAKGKGKAEERLGQRKR
jgi:hypothetical protein